MNLARQRVIESDYLMERVYPREHRRKVSRALDRVATEAFAGIPDTPHFDRELIRMFDRLCDSLRYRLDELHIKRVAGFTAQKNYGAALGKRNGRP